MIKPRRTPIILSGQTDDADDVIMALGHAPEPAQEIIARFSYDALDPETRIVVRQRTGEIKSLMRQTAQGVMDIGERLVEVKDRLGHGPFGGWLHQEFGWSERTAQNFMAVARRFKSANFADLNIAPSALYLLAGASVPEAANGKPVTHRQARQIVELHRPAPPAPAPDPADPYSAVTAWLAGRFSNDRQRRFALLDLLNSKAASQYWPSIARLLPGVDEADVLVALDAARADLDASPEMAPARPAPPPARITFQPPTAARQPASRPPSDSERLEALRRRLADLLLLPHSATDDELVEAVETAVTAWRLSEER